MNLSMEWLYVAKFMKFKFNQHSSNFRHHLPKIFVLLQSLDRLQFNRFFWIALFNYEVVDTKLSIKSAFFLFLTILTGKTMFYSVHYKNDWLAASEIFHMFTLSIKFYTFHYHILKGTDVWRRWFIKKTVKMNGYPFQQVLRQNFSWLLF